MGKLRFMVARPVGPERIGVSRREFAAIYTEFGGSVYGACVAILRDRDEAAEAMREVFVLAVQRISELRDRDRLRPWLFALARHVCFRRLHEGGGVKADASLTPDAADKETAALIWDATAGVSEIDRAVLFDVAQGLHGDDLADAVGVPHASAHAVVRRARSHLDEAVSVLVVARFGRSDCPTVDAMLETWDGVLTPALRRRIARHIDMCPTCALTKRRTYEMPVITEAVLSVAGQPPALTAAEVFEIALRSPFADEVRPRDGFPPPEYLGRKRRRLAFLSGSAFTLGVVLVVLTSMLGDPGSVPAPVSADAAPAHAAPTHRPSSPPPAVPSSSPASGVAGSTAATPPASVPTSSTTSPQSAPSAVDSASAVIALLIADSHAPRPASSSSARAASSPPVTRPPVTSPPSTSPPVTEPPTTVPPTTVPPPPTTVPPTTVPPPPTTTPPTTVPHLTLPSAPVLGVVENRAIGALQSALS